MYYINSKAIMLGCKSVTTEFEFSTRELAEKKLDKILTIRMSDDEKKEFSYFNDYYISTRCSKDWTWQRDLNPEKVF